MRGEEEEAEEEGRERKKRGGGRGEERSGRTEDERWHSQVWIWISDTGKSVEALGPSPRSRGNIR